MIQTTLDLHQKSSQICGFLRWSSKTPRFRKYFRNGFVWRKTFLIESSEIFVKNVFLLHVDMEYLFSKKMFSV